MEPASLDQGRSPGEMDKGFVEPASMSQGRRRSFSLPRDKDLAYTERRASADLGPAVVQGPLDGYPCPCFSSPPCTPPPAAPRPAFPAQSPPCSPPAAAPRPAFLAQSPPCSPPAAAPRPAFPGQSPLQGVSFSTPWHKSCLGPTSAASQLGHVQWVNPNALYMDLAETRRRHWSRRRAQRAGEQPGGNPGDVETVAEGKTAMRAHRSHRLQVMFEDMGIKASQG